MPQGSLTKFRDKLLIDTIEFAHSRLLLVWLQ